MRPVALLAALVSGAAFAQPLPTVAPERAGFSSQGLARIDQFFAREIQANRVPGAVVAIARDGQLVYYKAHGFLDKSKNEPMPVDAIFQLASMTKIMASVGGLALNEQGRLPLKSRLDEYLPGFAKMSVGVPSAGGELALEPAKQPIFIHDLFRHTSGITYGGRGSTAVHKLYPAGSAAAAAQYTGEEFVAKLSSLPLLHQPGTVWDYSFSTDVLGLVIEKVTGRPLGDYLNGVRVGQVAHGGHLLRGACRQAPSHRAAAADRSDHRQAAAHRQPRGRQQVPVRRRLRLRHGWRLRPFGQMLMNGGTLDGQRVLSPTTVANAQPPPHWNFVGVSSSAICCGLPLSGSFGSGRAMRLRLSPGTSKYVSSMRTFSHTAALR